MPTAYHMVHYRKLSSPYFVAQKSNTEALCRSILNGENKEKVTLWQRIEDRVLDLADGEERQIILNRVADLSSAVFGEMILMQKGGFQAFLEMQAKNSQLSNLTVAEVYQLAERAAPDGSSFVRGMMYWIIINDHLLFIKTQSMTTENFSEYINWLFRGLLSTPADRIVLQAEFDKSQVGGDIGDIQSLRVIGRSAVGLAMTPAKDGQVAATKSTTRKVAGRLVESAKALPIVELLFGETRTQSLVDSLGPEEYLAVDAEVKVRGRRTAESKERLKALASEVADLTDAEVRIEGRDGNVKDGDAILRTRMPFNLAHVGSSILEFDNVADQLQEVYSRFVHDGKIAAE